MEIFVRYGKRKTMRVHSDNTFNQSQNPDDATEGRRIRRLLAGNTSVYDVKIRKC